LSADPALWTNAEKAQNLMREQTHLQTQVDAITRLQSGLRDHAELIEMAQAEGDERLVRESERALEALKLEAEKRQLHNLLSGEADGNDAYLQVNAGAGGTEAQDWAQMLLRMYIRWAEQHDYKVTVLETSPGEEAGLKSATIEVKGPQAFGWLKTESGVHRLVRISPFDSNARRHTSFASIGVSPVVDENINIEVLEKDLRVDTYRSQGAGGQHVNTTDSAVRITHIPSGIVVACQSERSQHQNRAHALNMLRARLYEAELRKREEAAQAERGQKTEIGWGHQLRSYVLHPYQMVKDLRTGVETTQSQDVLNGDLDMFLEAALAQKLNSKTAQS
jgi:peptide chain release factor 2